MSYFIYSDVSLDIERGFAKDEDIRFVPMEYMVGGAVQSFSRMRRCTIFTRD